MSIYYKWYRSIFGCSQMKINGEKEKLLNLLLEKKVYFWGTELDGDGCLLIYGNVFSAGRIIEEAESIGCEVSVVKRKGLPFIFERYKKRYGIIVGMVLAWAILFLSSLSIWEVRLAERSGEDPQKIYELLRECGLEMGTFLPTLNVRAVENQFLINNPEYSFIAVNICGTVANIEIRRAASKIDPEDKSKLCNVVSISDGTIVSVEAYGGSPVVKKGDVVSQGDVLISAYMDGSFGTTRCVHAYGKVTAEVEYEYNVEIPIKYETDTYTGNTETKMSIQLLNFKLPLFKDEKTSFQKCKAVSSWEQKQIFGIKLPIIVEKTVYYKQKTTYIHISSNEAKSKAYEEFELWKKRELDGEIVFEAVEETFDEKKGLYYLSSTVRVWEDIGKKEFLE